MKLKGIIGHFKTVHTHRKWVRHYCFLAGLYRRGLMHDLSKYSPTEFFESAEYYTDGTSSPIDACKKDKGWSKAWQHHKGRNTHHYEYWQDNFDKGGTQLLMPYKDALEMVCDYLAAGRAYQKDKFTYEGEYEWWLNKIKSPLAMHPAIKAFMGEMLLAMVSCENNKDARKVLRNDSWYIYTDCSLKYAMNKLNDTNNKINRNL